MTFTLTEAKEYIHKGFETQAAVLIASAAMKPMIMTMQTKIPIAMKEQINLHLNQKTKLCQQNKTHNDMEYVETMNTTHNSVEKKCQFNDTENQKF